MMILLPKVVIGVLFTGKARVHVGGLPLGSTARRAAAAIATSPADLADRPLRHTKPTSRSPFAASSTVSSLIIPLLWSQGIDPLEN